PINSAYPSVERAWALQFLFVCAVTFSYLLTSRYTKFSEEESGQRLYLISAIDVRQLIYVSYTLSLLGLLLLIYDKVVIQDINYSAGFASAREQWKEASDARDHAISSIFSVLGYLLSSSYFLPVAVLLSRHAKLTDSSRITYLSI